MESGCGVLVFVSGNHGMEVMCIGADLGMRGGSPLYWFLRREQRSTPTCRGTASVKVSMLSQDRRKSVGAWDSQNTVRGATVLSSLLGVRCSRRSSDKHRFP